MRVETRRTLEQLQSLQWFANAGRTDGTGDICAKTWQDAVDSCAGEVWSSVQLQVKNRIAGEVRQRDHRRAQEWNGIAGELRKTISPLAESVIQPIVTKHKLTTDFQGSVAWDMLMICMESEFSDLLQPMFFEPRLLPVYASGHFPCGWEGQKLDEGWAGKLPVARLLIY